MRTLYQLFVRRYKFWMKNFLGVQQFVCEKKAHFHLSNWGMGSAAGATHRPSPSLKDENELFFQKNCWTPKKFVHSKLVPSKNSWSREFSNFYPIFAIFLQFFFILNRSKMCSFLPEMAEHVWDLQKVWKTYIILSRNKISKNLKMNVFSHFWKVFFL